VNTEMNLRIPKKYGSFHQLCNCTVLKLYPAEWNLNYVTGNLPVSIAARSKASTVFGRSNIGIAGSNPARGMDVCLCFSVFVLSCV
jgi:hypothetical protein